MAMRALLTVISLVPAAIHPVSAQTAKPSSPKLAGVWQAMTADGPQNVTVRTDSTAQFGQDSVRWRLRADTIFILFGEEWVGYNYLLNADTLTLSGGDLEEPVRLLRIGPPPKAANPATRGQHR